MPLGELARYRVRFLLEGLGVAHGELVRFQAPRTVESILRMLPLEGRAALWKDEVYFQVPIRLGAEKPRSKVESGSIAYWPMGSSICIFHEAMEPYSPVNLVGQVTGNLAIFKEVKSGIKIRMERA